MGYGICAIQIHIHVHIEIERQRLRLWGSGAGSTPARIGDVSFSGGRMG